MSNIKIKKSRVGSLRKAMGAKDGEKLSLKDMQKKKKNASPAMKKKLTFAINARNWKHEDGGLIPEYSWGGVLANTAAGAGMGAMVGGPFGAIVGGAGALIKGALGEVTANKEEELKKRQENLANAQTNFNTMMGGGVQNPFTATFAYGGTAGALNAEIEKGETSVSPDGRMRQFNLPSHAQVTGDNFKYFDPGTMIFSDKLKFNKNKTFAQEQLTYKKVSDKAEKTLKNPGSTFLNKKTAKLNKENALKMSVDLFSKQEAMKMSKAGGRVPKAQDGLRAGFPLPQSMYDSWGYPIPPVTVNAKNTQFPFQGGMYKNWQETGFPIGAVTVRPDVSNNFPLPNNMYNTWANQPQPSSRRNMRIDVSGINLDQAFNGINRKPSSTTTSSSNNMRIDLGGVNMGAGFNRNINVPINDFNNGYSSNNIGGNFRVPVNSVSSGTGQTSGQMGGYDPMANVRYDAPLVGDMNIDVNAAMAATDKSTSPVNYAKLANDFDVAGATPGGKTPMNWGGIGMQALSLAPDIYNLGQALFSKPEKLSRSRYFNPYTNQIRSRMNDRRFNIDPILAANRNANAVYNRNVTNAAGGDRSRVLSNLLAGMNARQGADAAAYSQKINMDNQYRGQQAEMDYGLGQSQAQALALRDDINARNLAAQRNFGAAAASGVQRYALNQMQMNNQSAAQRAYLDVLERSNPFFNQWLGLDELRSYGKYNR